MEKSHTIAKIRGPESLKMIAIFNSHHSSVTLHHLKFFPIFQAIILDFVLNFEIFYFKNIEI